MTAERQGSLEPSSKEVKSGPLPNPNMHTSPDNPQKPTEEDKKTAAILDENKKGEIKKELKELKENAEAEDENKEKEEGHENNNEKEKENKKNAETEERKNLLEKARILEEEARKRGVTHFNLPFILIKRVIKFLLKTFGIIKESEEEAKKSEEEWEGIKLISKAERLRAEAMQTRFKGQAIGPLRMFGLSKRPNANINKSNMPPSPIKK